MKQPLILIGAGNVGGYLAYNISDFPEYEILGILDDDPSKHGKSMYGYQVLGEIEALFGMDCSGLSVAICLHDPSIKKEVFVRIQGLGLLFPSFISPYAWISKGCIVGKGSIIYPGVSINHESQIGDFVNINMNCALGHNALVGHFSSFAPGVSLGGNTTLEEGVDMGIGSSTLQGVTIGRFSVIGGKAMIIDNIPENSKVVGVPGKVIGNGVMRDR
jgi:sugar O-acyltransferase (sialic acid O-acetyltransferase NeuD family)